MYSIQPCTTLIHTRTHMYMYILGSTYCLVAIIILLIVAMTRNLLGDVLLSKIK